MDQRVLAFDVGLTSLGFCDMSRDANNVYRILNWGVVNLLECVGCDIPARKVSVPILIRILNILLPVMFPHAHLYDSIVVEQQNARQASQRKCVHISYIIYQYFNLLNPHTKLVSANVKFKTHELRGLSCVQPVFSPFVSSKALAASTIKKKEYDHRKLYCVESAKCVFAAMLSQYPANAGFKAILEAPNKSASDTADAFLLALSEFE